MLTYEGRALLSYTTTRYLVCLLIQTLTLARTLSLALRSPSPSPNPRLAQGRVEGLLRRSPHELPARLERLLQVLPSYHPPP